MRRRDRYGCKGTEETCTSSRGRRSNGTVGSGGGEGSENLGEERGQVNRYGFGGRGAPAKSLGDGHGKQVRLSREGQPQRHSLGGTITSSGSEERASGD
jgi:hypothetical protein